MLYLKVFPLFSLSYIYDIHVYIHVSYTGIYNKYNYKLYPVYHVVYNTYHISIYNYRLYNKHAACTICYYILYMYMNIYRHVHVFKSLYMIDKYIRNKIKSGYLGRKMNYGKRVISKVVGQNLEGWDILENSTESVMWTAFRLKCETRGLQKSGK